MKKTVSLALILAMLLALTACAPAADPGSVFEMTPEELAALTAPATEPPSQAGTQPPAPENGPEGEYPVIPGYSYGNRQRQGEFMLYGNECLFLMLDKSVSRLLLCSLNMDTHEVRLFCRDATCDHTGAKCVSLGVEASLEAYGGTVYGRDFSGECALKVLKDGRFETVVDGGVSEFWHAGGKLYAVTKDSALVVFREGSREPEILIEEYVAYGNVAFGDHLYATNRKGDIIHTDLSAAEPQPEVLVKYAYPMIDGTHIYYTDGKTGLLWRCGMDGSDPVQLLDRPVSGLNFDGEYLYFRFFADEEGMEHRLEGPDSHALYRLSKEDPGEPELIAAFPEDVFIMGVYTVPGYEEIIVEGYSLAFDENGQPILNEGWDGAQDHEYRFFLVDRDGGIEELKLPEGKH